MKRFCVITNSYKDDNCQLAHQVCQYILSKGGECVVIDSVDESTGAYRDISVDEVPTDIQCAIAIGGDGTLLHTAKDFENLDIVFIGINKGSMGFLAEIGPKDWEVSIDKLLNSEFDIKPRMMLNGVINRDNNKIYEGNVLNDIVIHRGDALSISDYKVYVNGKFLVEYQADGLIIATPTGSSAYNLSAGGPVAKPTSELIILTPICPHSFGNRSIIFTKDDHIVVEIGNTRTPNVERRKVAFDGDKGINILSGDKIEIKAATVSTKIARLDQESFIQVIKDKLGD